MRPARILCQRTRSGRCGLSNLQTARAGRRGLSNLQTARAGRRGLSNLQTARAGRRGLSNQQKPYDVEAMADNEFKDLAAAVGRRLEKQCNLSGKAIAAEADLDHDGVVTEAELSAWWRRRASTLLAVSASRATAPPTRSQLLKLGLVAAVPCFTFGFLDNAIMLVAGEQIEAHLGISLGLSAMACAAMGNIVADTTGQVSGGTVERLLRPVLPAANLSATQLGTKSASRVQVLGGALGIATGCMFGSFPLLFYQEPKDDDDCDACDASHAGGHATN